MERARQGDREAFAELYAPLERPLAAFLYRMIAVRADADDLAQETAVEALETIERLAPGASFRPWIFGIAARVAVGHLAGEKTWDPEALFRAGQRAREDAGVRRRLQALHDSDLHTSYNLREHIDFCFTRLGRTLPPHEQAALLLAEVHGFSPEEAATAQGIPSQTLRFRVQQARQTLVEHLDQRCSLINKDGSCNECAALDTLTYADRRHTEQALFQIDLEPRPTAQERAAAFDRRLAIVRTIEPLHAEGTKFHEFLMELTRKFTRY